MDKVIKYSNWIEDNNPIKNLQSSVDRAMLCGYSNINIVLIQMMKCQQLGQKIDSIVTDEFINTAKCVRNALSTLLFFDKWLQPEIENNQDVCDAIYTHFTLECVVTKLKSINNCPDFFDIYVEYINKPNELPENTKVTLLNLFTLPKKATIKSGFSCIDKEVNLNKTVPFVFSNQNTNPQLSKYQSNYILYRLPQNCSGYKISDLLESYAMNQLSKKFWIDFHKGLIKIISEFKHRIDLLNKMKNRTQIINIKYQIISFPIILIVDENSNIMEKINHEYRAKRSLKLGEDIIIIATNNNLNKEHLKNYLERHNINCSIKLFNELKNGQ